MRWIVLFFCAGCYDWAEDRCRGCDIVSAVAPDAPPCRRARRVVLVHGAFGFGREWEPVVARLRAQPELDFVVYRWRGPWGGLERRVDELERVLQRMLDGAGPEARELVVLAHSAGGVIADYAARRLRVPPRLRVRVVTVAPPPYLKVLPLPRLPPRVEIVEYLDAARDDGLGREPGARRIVLGPVGHDAALKLLPAVLDSRESTADRR